MILYDNAGLFLGIGRQELNLLGYEDMEEFRRYHNDFADLFVNQPGYVFKFKNFSWIDYVLHSGTPNKRVLIKTKNGKKIETSLNIQEIYLQNDINNISLLYSVELTSGNAFANSIMPSSEPFLSENSLDYEEQVSLPQPPTETHFQKISESTESFFEPDHEISKPLDDFSNTKTETFLTADEPSTVQEKTYSFLDDIPLPTFSKETEAPIESNEPLSFDFTPKLPVTEEQGDFKLKLDFDILDKPILDEPISNDDTLHEQEKFITTLEEQPVELKPLRLKETFVAPTPSLPHQDSREEAFDLATCAEELGLDFITLAQIIEEYSVTLDTTMPLLEEAIIANNRYTAKQEIDKLKSVALHLQISSLYQHFEHLERSLEFDTKEEIRHVVSNLHKTIEQFKEAIS